MSDVSNPNPFASPMDVSAAISRLFVYPVKSCAGVEVQQAILTETGLEFDRAWMVVDGQGNFLTQRDLPRMALVRPQLKYYEMVLRAPGMLALHIALDKVELPVRVRVWGDDVAAYDMGPIAAQWFSDFLGIPARLVRFDPEQQRPCSRTWTGDTLALNQFSDGYPIMLISQASLVNLNGKLVAAGHAPVGMERFRPNVVLGDVPQAGGTQGLSAHDEDRIAALHIATEEGMVELRPVKPCQRCPIPNIDPTTAISHPAVTDMLQTYRQDARVGGALTFGMNLILIKGVDHELKIGQQMTANYSFA